MIVANLQVEYDPHHRTEHPLGGGTVNDDATIGCEPDKQRNKILRFQVLDRQNFAAAMTAITAELLAGIGR